MRPESGRLVHRLTAWVRARPAAALCLLPLLIYVLTFTVAPMLDTVRLSLTARGDGGFPSLDNYRALAGSDVFRRALGNTLGVVALSLALQLGAGLALALALRRRFPGRGLVRAVVLLPMGVPSVVAGAVMLLVFARSGYLNTFLLGAADGASAALGVDWRPPATSWLVAGGWRTLLVLAVADTWKVLPFVVLILLGGLTSIGPEVDEAADVDGASPGRRFWFITLPLLAPFLTTAIVLRAIDAFRLFELALVLAGRVEPVLGTYVWSRYGPPTSDPFTAAAGACVLAALILTFVALYARLAAGPER